jgi:hypothetical protein
MERVFMCQYSLFFFLLSKQYLNFSDFVQVHEILFFSKEILFYFQAIYALKQRFIFHVNITCYYMHKKRERGIRIATNINSGFRERTNVFFFLRVLLFSKNYFREEMEE